VTSSSRASTDPLTRVLDPDFFVRPTPEVARNLLGFQIVSVVEGELTQGTIVETEAYGGAEDPASHAAVKAGRTSRNASMFGPPGRAYIYLGYGVHWCLNVVTRPDGEPGAVLIRSIEPGNGAEVMRRRRGGRLPLAIGPARLTQALGVTGALDGHDLSQPPLQLFPGSAFPDSEVRASPRIGISKARSRLHRFHIVTRA